MLQAHLLSRRRLLALAGVAGLVPFQAARLGATGGVAKMASPSPALPWPNNSVVSSPGTLVRPRSGSAQRQWRVSGSGASELSHFDAVIEAFMRQRSISAGALAVVRRGRLLLARGYAWSEDPTALVEPTALFRVASLSKPITATAALLLVQAGRLTLDDRLTRLMTLQPLPGASPDPRLDDVTIGHLLQHLGGWDRDRGFDPSFSDRPIAASLNKDLPISIADIIAYTTGRSLDYAPGARYAYGNYGYLLLGRVIEQLTGLAYASFVAEAIMRPLSLQRLQLGRSSAVHRLPNEVAYNSIYSAPSVIDTSGATVPLPYGGFNLENRDAHGGWVASAVDLVRFATSFDQDAAQPLLTPQSLAMMFAQPPTGINAEGWYYAKGWQVRPRGGGLMDTWHMGSLPGTTALMVRRADAVNYVALFNQRDDPDDPGGQSYQAIAEDLYAAADSTGAWPEYDLFPAFFPLPQEPQRLYLPALSIP